MVNSTDDRKTQKLNAPVFTAKAFVEKQKKLQSKKELEKIQRYFKSDYSKGDKFIGVQMGKLLSRSPETRVNFDLDDCDKILRIEGHQLNIHKIMEVVIESGYACEVLEE